MGVLDVLSGLSAAAGQGYQGYAADEQTKAKRILAQAQAAREAERDRVLNLLTQKEIARQSPGDAGYGQYKAGEIAATAPAQTAAKVADINATAQPTATAAGLKVSAETPGLVDRANQMVPVEAAKAGAVAGAEVAPHVLQATQINKAKPDHMTPVITTAPGGAQHVSAFDTESGKVIDTGAGAKASTGGGAGDVMAKRASAALPQIDAALKTFDQYHEPGAAGRLFARNALGGYVMSPEGQMANQAATALAQAYAGAKSRSGVPSATSVHDLSQQILIQPGEAENPALVSAKIARAHAWRDELAQLGSSKQPASGAGGLQDTGGKDPHWDELVAALRGKKGP